jgi:hypothetical protein
MIKYLFVTLKKDFKMDLQTCKINFVQDFLKLESVKIVAQFEKLLQEETDNDIALKPMTISEFEARIAKSTNDSKNGKLTDVDALLSEIEKWS